MAMKQENLKMAFTFLEAGPVTLITTHDGEKSDIMTISWTMVMNFKPNIAIATGPWNESFGTMMKTKECTICIPASDMIEKAIEIGTCNGSETDKFAKFGLTAVKGEAVKSPLINECIACIECSVIDYIQKYNLVILEGKKLWWDRERENQKTFHANGDGTFIIDGETVNLRDRMRKWVPEGSERF